MEKNQKINKQGEDFFNKQWGDERIRVHSQCVIEACLNMTKNTELDIQAFIIAGWIHDLGIKYNKEKHHIISLDFLNEFLKENNNFIYLEKELKDCIINHRSGGTPETIYGIIFKCADKVALYNKKWLEYKKNKTSS